MQQLTNANKQKEHRLVKLQDDVTDVSSVFQIYSSFCVNVDVNVTEIFL